jgi:hypothetical protein
MMTSNIAFQATLRTKPSKPPELNVRVQNHDVRVQNHDKCVSKEGGTMKQAILLLALVIAGCANPYAKFYQGMPDARVSPNYLQSNEDLKLFSTDDFK